MVTVEGKSVVVTGKIAGESRQTAEAKLRQAGAHVQASVTKETDLLVIGGAVGATKTNAAAKLGVRVVSWEQVWDAPERPRPSASPSPYTLPPRPPQPSVREIGPMLCKGADDVPAGSWLFEVKWDGYRGVATIDGNGGVTIQSRQGNDLTGRFPEVAAELATLPACVLDGELVSLDEQGRSSFADLGTGVSRFAAFDLLEADGQDLRALPIEQRKQLLGEIVRGCQLIAESPVFTDGEQLLGYAAEQGLEGIVAKRAGSRYDEGARGPAWLKIKLRCEQEFVVVGYTAGKGARTGTAGALLLAVNEDDGLVYCGSVGTGGSYADWDALVAQTVPAAAAAASHSLSRADTRDVTWVEPTIVVQVRFQRWTTDGRLWHPSLQGQRTDKRPVEVVRESCLGQAA